MIRNPTDYLWNSIQFVFHTSMYLKLIMPRNLCLKVDTWQEESVHDAWEYVSESSGLNKLSVRPLQSLSQDEHCTQQRSLPVSAIAWNSCGGVPKEICITKSPEMAFTGLCKDVSCFTRLRLRFTASWALWPGVFIDALVPVWRLSMWMREDRNTWQRKEKQ